MSKHFKPGDIVLRRTAEGEVLATVESVEEWPGHTHVEFGDSTAPTVFEDLDPA